MTQQQEIMEGRIDLGIYSPCGNGDDTLYRIRDIWEQLQYKECICEYSDHRIVLLSSIKRSQC